MSTLSFLKEAKLKHLFEISKERDKRIALTQKRKEDIDLEKLKKNITGLFRRKLNLSLLCHSEA